MPEKGVITLVAWVSVMLYNQENFDLKEMTTTEYLYPSALLRAGQKSSTPFCYTF